MHRFFISPEAFASHPVVLTGDQAHQIRRVLRLRLGERVTLLDGQGYAYEAILIALDEADVKFQVVKRSTIEGEPRTVITLYQAVLKGDNVAWVLQKGTEVGVARFVPMVCERNVVDDLDAVEGKRERWQRIIQEAAEQSGRGRLPELAPAELFRQAVAPPHSPPLRQGGGVEFPPAAAGGTEEGGLRLLAWEGERVSRLRDALAGCNFADGARIQIFVGPEGGFSEAEVALARRYGVQPVTLGPRILRAETAGVVAAAMILYEAGDV
jgi:16S rRNA (uracil1498-N3)-methyltransferase